MMHTDTVLVQEGRYVPANGLNMYYEEYGTGEPLVLVQGGSLTGKITWGACIPAFSEHFRLLIPDTRGHGKTDNPAGEFSYPLLADDLAAFIQALGLKRPLICGYSDGGQAALELGMRYPGLASSLIVAAASYYFSDDYFQVWNVIGFEEPGKVNFEKVRQAFPDLFSLWQQVHNDVYGPDYWQTLIQQISRMWLTPLAYSEVDLQRISAPMLILLGDRDRLNPVRQAFEMYEMIPEAELAVAPNAGHFFCLENPELFSKICLDFLLRHTGGESQI